MLSHFYKTHRAVTGLKKQNLLIYRGYSIISVYFEPHLGHTKVDETSIWTPCFQILAKTISADGSCLEILSSQGTGYVPFK